VARPPTAQCVSTSARFSLSAPPLRADAG
jgi:hypothetical protein